MMHSLEPPSRNVKLFYALSALAAFLSLGLSCAVGIVLESIFSSNGYPTAPSVDQMTHLGPLIVAVGACIVTLPGIILAIVAARKSTRKADVIIAILVFIFVAAILAINVAIWSLDAFANFEPVYL